MDAVRLLGLLEPHLEACGARWRARRAVAGRIGGETEAAIVIRQRVVP
jgi:hypothetical protein